MVMNSKDTYFGGPTHSDLTVDGILYNYISSNHHGDQTVSIYRPPCSWSQAYLVTAQHYTRLRPHIRTGMSTVLSQVKIKLTCPQTFHYFNRFPPETDILTLQQDAAQYADPEWNADFYDSIAEHVPNYVPSSERATWKLHVDLPKGATRALAVLSQNRFDFQDNVLDPTAYQYWADVDEDGYATIPMVKAGTYRLTIYADGIFGQYIEDNVKVVAGGKHHANKMTRVRWHPETHGKEIWRIGTPDRSCGEFRHGHAPDTEHALHPAQYRIYWGNYDFPADFPDGVRFKVGESDEATDWNYVHWSVFGGKASHRRPETYVGNGDVNNWTVAFDLEQAQIERKKQATLTVQLAGAKTAAGNTDVYNASEPHANLYYTVNVNGKDLEPWIIP